MALEAGDSKQSTFVVRSGVIFLNDFSVIFFIFAPKVAKSAFTSSNAESIQASTFLRSVISKECSI